MYSIKLPYKFFFTLIICVFLLGANAQTKSIDYFEVNTAISSDSMTSAVQIIITITNAADVDSLRLRLTGMDESILYSDVNTIAAWKAIMPFREEHQVLYLTIEAGVFSLPDHIAAELSLTPPNGESLFYTWP